MISQHQKTFFFTKDFDEKPNIFNFFIQKIKTKSIFLILHSFINL